jgi:hypothetical protein
MNLASDYIEALDAALQGATRSLIQELDHFLDIFLLFMSVLDMLFGGW